MNKTIEQRGAYHDRKAKELDEITNPFRYARRLERLMKYQRLISQLITKKANEISKGDKEKMTKNEVQIISGLNKGDLKEGGMEAKEIVRNLVSETSHHTFHLSAELTQLEVIQGAVARLMERIDEITYKKWDEDATMARLSIDEIKDTVRLIDMAFHPLFTTMNKGVKKLETHSSKLFDIIVKQEDIKKA